MKKAMDLFGDALQAYEKGDRTPFYFLNGKLREQHDLSRYFRTSRQLSKLENKMVSLCKGNILDVGCATANYFPKLLKQGKVTGIDISPTIIAIAKKNGFDCVAGDIFTFKPKMKYDTITLFENNLGMAGTVSKTKPLLKKLFSLLDADGQILIMLRNATGKKYVQVNLQPIWNGITGEKFTWVIYNKNYLKKLCLEIGLRLEALQSEDNNYIIRITRKKKIIAALC